MNNSYIPEVFKEKLHLIFKYIYAFSLLLFSISSFLALLTFNIDENSFLTSTNYETQNLLGNLKTVAFKELTL